MAGTGNKHRREQLSTAKKALLEERMRAARQRITPTIPRRSADEPRQLSSAQERIWFLMQLEPDLTAYNRPLALRLKGSLDYPVLQRALEGVMLRHEVLRWRFPAQKGAAIVQVDPDPDLDLKVVRLEQSPLTSPFDQALSLAVKDAWRPFDLANEIPLRASLYVIGEQDHVLSLTFHHIAFDAWSARVFIRELAELYEAYQGGKEAALPDLPIQFGDYAAWQRKLLQSVKLDDQLAYWKDYLADLPPPISLPMSKPHPKRETYRGSNYSLEIRPDLSTGLRALARDQGVTLFMVLLGAFQILLFRYSGQDDVIVGTPVSERTHLESEALIGLFINTLLIRIDLSDESDFLQVLQRLKMITLESLARRELPFDTLVQALKPERDSRRTPIFQVMFNLENLPELPVYQIGDLSVEAFDFDDGNAQFDLSLEIIPRDDRLVCTFNYNTDLFSSETITRVAHHYNNLLAGIVADQRTSISDLPLMSQDEQKLVVFDWNQTELDFSDLDFAHRLFEAQVAQTPHAPAVVNADQVLSYQQLNERANQLAHYLRRMGVGPDTLVGICIPRSFDLVVAIYGVLKAGGVYIPFDPTYPPARLAFMITDSQPIVLLTHQDLARSLGNNINTNIVCLDIEWPHIAVESTDNPNVELNFDNLAYVIYTSGSTGAPKGVMIPQRALSNHIFWMQHTYPLHPEDKILQSTPIGFDVSIWEFFGPLAVGAQLVMAEPMGHMDLGYLLATIIQQRITILQVVPSVLRLMVEEKRFVSCVSLRRLLCGGETMTVDLAKQVLDALDLQLINLYGPTEACIDSTSYLVEGGFELRTVPIGRPIANVKTYILDSNLRPLPVGMSGELFISGKSVGRGYLNRPQLTAERFLPDPFNSAGEDCVMMYATGDLARYLPDGNIEFLGRLDNQVKVHGVRIELAEIERAIESHIDVRQAVVFSKKNNDDMLLVAFIVLRSSCTLQAHDLRSYISKRLPSYMIPPLIFFVDSIPLSPSGKVDQGSLQQFDAVLSGGQTKYRPPTTALEQALVKIWEQILNVDGIDLMDNFFSMGGHSLLAMRLIAHINDLFQTNLSLREFYDVPTPEGMAKMLIADGEFPQDDRDANQLERRAELILQLAAMTEEQAQSMLDKRSSLSS